MHRKQILLLNLVLAAACLLLGWRLAAEWRATSERQQARLAGKPAAAPRQGAPPAPVQQQPLPGGGEIAARNVFSPDRNNDIAPPKTAPVRVEPLPVLFGTMNLGGAMEALLAHKDQAASRAFRRVKEGETFGPYKVVQIRDEGVVVELEGQRTTLEVYQSAATVPRAEARTAPPAAPVVVSASAPAPAAASPAGPAAGATAAAAQPGVTSPEPGVRMTIVGDRKRFERDTPMGVAVWYEPLEK